MIANQKTKNHYIQIREAYFTPELFEEAEQLNEVIDSRLRRIEDEELRNEIDILVGRLLVAHEAIGYTVARLEAEELSQFRDVLNRKKSFGE